MIFTDGRVAIGALILFGPWLFVALPKLHAQRANLGGMQNGIVRIPKCLSLAMSKLVTN